MRFSIRFILLALLVPFSLQAIASGYQVLLQGNRQAGLGNLGVGLRPDASSVFWNPGSIAFINGGSITAGVNLIGSKNYFWDSATPNSRYQSETDNPLGTPFHLYAVWSPRGADWKAGIGIYTPFGSTVDWGNNWLGKGLLQELELKSYYLQPTISYKLTERFSIGGGITIAFGDVKLKKALPIFTPDGTASATLDDRSKVALGYNIGLLFKASDNLLLGASHRSKVRMDIEGGNTQFNVPASMAPLLFQPGINYQDITFDASLPMPAISSFGVSFYPDDKVMVGFEASLAHWSVYDALQIDYSSTVNGVQRSLSPREYENSWSVKLGASYKIIEPLELRAGVYYDETPVKTGFMTPETPDQDRFNYTAGIGYAFSDKLSLDASFLWIIGQRRSQSTLDGVNAGTIVPTDLPNNQAGSQDVLPGTYKSVAYIAGLSLNYNF